MNSETKNCQNCPDFLNNLKMFYTYILHSAKNGRYYIGSCEDLEKRLKRHNAGLVKSTKFYLPWKMVYNEKYQTLSEARKRESQLKRWKKRSAIEELIKHFQI